MRNGKLTLFVSLLLCIGYQRLQAQAISYQPDVFNFPTPMSAVKTANALPYNLPATSHGWYAQMTAQYPPFCQWSYDFKSIQDYIEVKIDKRCMQPMTDFDYTFVFSVSTVNGNPVPGTQNISGAQGALGQLSGGNTVSLRITYNHLSGAKYKDEDLYKFANAHYFTASLTNIFSNSPGTQPMPVNLSSMPDCILFETGVAAERIDHVQTNNLFIPSLWSLQNGNLTIRWDYPCYYGNTIYPKPKSVDYELEWTYVDDYSYNLAANSAQNIFGSSSGTINYNFTGNATRVRVSDNIYSIPLVYQRGAIVYRVRALIPNQADYREIQYGDWSLPASGSISVGDPNLGNKAYIITQPHYANLNWQYSINFAEEGKYKHVINYFDGALKNRQTQTKINSDPDHVLVVDHAFDYEGNTAITSLPTPVVQPSVGYRNDILVKPGAGAITAADFDSRGTASTVCIVPSTVATPSLASANNAPPTSLAELYYSPANPLATDALHQFVPKSEGFPYSQSIYAPENPKKVLAQGGPGPNFQINSAGGHYTLNDYLDADPNELDRLLGTEAGNSQFYPKTVTTDPNGQTSVAIVNKYGKPTASYLVGAAPAGLSPLSGSTTSMQTSTSDLLANYEQKEVPGSITAESSFMLDGPGSPSSPTMAYDLTVKPFPACVVTGPALLGQTPQVLSQVNLQIPAKVEISVTNACGDYEQLIAQSPASIQNSVYTAASGAININAGNTNTIFNTQGNILPSQTMTKGKYSYTKKVTFSAEDIDSVVRFYIHSNPSIYSNVIQPYSGSCTFRTNESFVASSIEQITKPCTLPTTSAQPPASYCDVIRQKMKDELWPGHKYGSYVGLNGLFLSGNANSIFTQTLTTPSNFSTNSPCAIVYPANWVPLIGGGTLNCTQGCTHNYTYNNNSFVWINAPGIHTSSSCTTSGFGQGAPCTPIMPPTPTGGWANNASIGGITTCNYGCQHAYHIVNNAVVIVSPGIHTASCTQNNNTSSNCPPCQLSGFPFLVQDNDISLCGIAWYCQYGHLHQNSAQVPRFWAGTTTYIPNSAFNPQGPTYTYTGPFTSQPAYYDDPSHHNNCQNPVIYRYQSPCLTTPIAINGVTTTLQNVDPQTLIANFSDAIADALLPLHPEYCKLLFCGDDDFVAKLTNTKSFQDAQAQHFFDLDNPSLAGDQQNNLTLVGQDPLYSSLMNSSADKINWHTEFTHLPGYTASLPSSDPRSKNLRQLALEMAYCNAGSTNEHDECVANQYASQIMAGIYTDPVVQQRYWENLRNLYLVSHNYYKQKAMDAAANGGCGPCQSSRMTLVAPPVVPPVFSSTQGAGGDNLDSHLFDLDPDASTALQIDSLYGNNTAGSAPSVSLINGWINNPSTIPTSTTPPQVSENMDNKADLFLQPVKNSLSSGQYSVLLTYISAALGSNSPVDITPDYMNSLFANPNLSSNPNQNPPIQLTPFCNPYLLDYTLVRYANDESDTYFCGSQGLYDDVKDFANRLLATSGSISLNPSSLNQYEQKICAAVGLLPTATPTIATCTRANISGAGGAYWKYHISNGSLSSDVFISVTNSGITVLPGNGTSFTKGVCVNGEGLASDGWMAQNTAVLYGVPAPPPNTTPVPTTPNVRYVLWDQDALLMAPVTNPDMQRAVNAWDIRDGINAFTGDAAGYGYSLYYNHPEFQPAVTNYLNWRLHKAYSFTQYEALMKGCATGDQFVFPRYDGWMRMDIGSSALSSYIYTGIINQLKALADPSNANFYLHLSPGIIKLDYTDAASGTRHLLTDLSGVPPEYAQQATTILSAIAANNYATATPGAAPATGAAATLFIPNATSYTLPAIAGLSFSTPTAVSVMQGMTPVSCDRVTATYSATLLSTPPPNLAKAQSDALYALNQYIKTSLPYTFVIYESQLLRSDDYSTAYKANYLAAAGMGNINNHSQAVTALSTAAVGPYALTGSYTTPAQASYTYNDMLCTGKFNDFFIYPGGSTLSSANPLYQALSGYTNLVSTVTGSATPPFNINQPGGTYKRQLKKANGAYWFVYINNSPIATQAHGYEVYNTYLLPPPGVSVDGYVIDPTSILPTQCDKNGNFYGFTVNVALGASVISCKGYTDFPLAAGGIRLQDVMLYQSTAGTCYDAGDCEYQMLQSAIQQGNSAYQQYYQQQKESLVSRYYAFIEDPVNVTEHLPLTKTDNQYQFTLYFYDRAGNLMRSVPPQGVPNPTQTPIATVEADKADPNQQYQKLISYRKATEYQYNSLNQPVQQTSPDAGIVKYYYDDKGRIAFSQNAAQAVRSTGNSYYCSYSLYDDQGRPIETGEARLIRALVSPGTYGLPGLINKLAGHAPVDYDNEIVSAVRSSGTKKDVVETIYDAPTLTTAIAMSGNPYKLSAQDNLRKRVACVRYFSSPGVTTASGWDANPDYAVHYSYDVLGNVKTLTHEIKALANVRQQYKRIDYDYDLLSGKVDMVSYNRGFPDQFYHKYSYDADNRITKVETGNDGVLWAEDAKYDYYKHGPLAQVQLGSLNVQRMQYAYTLQGWLKAINGDLLNPNNDMGSDGKARTGPSDPTDVTAQDAIAHSLQYYNGDYKPIGATPVENLALTASAIAAPLFNGNIARQYTSIAGLSPNTTNSAYYGMERTYTYDQLNRLTGATNRGIDNGVAGFAAQTPSNLYASAYSYDKDGNILTLQRYDGGSGPGGSGSAAKIDDLNYDYTGIVLGNIPLNNNDHNRLQNVIESATSPVGYDDIKPFVSSNGTKTYQYDANGNLIVDQNAGPNSSLGITWNVYGKPSRVQRTYTGANAGVVTLNFGYDGLGNRIVKDVVTGAGATEHHSAEYYIRDAGGNVLAVYKDDIQYGKLILLQAWNGDIFPVIGGGGMGTVIKNIGLDYPGVASGILHAASANDPGWVTSITSAQPYSYYVMNDPVLVEHLLSSSDSYLNDLLAYSDATSQTGRQAIADAIESSEDDRISQLLATAMTDPTACRAILQHYGETMAPDVAQSYWQQYGQQYDPGDAAGSAQTLMSYLSGAGMVPQAASDLTATLPNQPPNVQQSFAEAIVGDDSVMRSPLLRAGVNTPFEQQVMDMLSNQGDEDWLAGFINQWSQTPQWIQNNISSDQMLQTLYSQQGENVIASLAAVDMDAISTAVANEPGVTLQDYAQRMTGAGVSASLFDPTNYSLSLAGSVNSETIGLAEHHIYGSQRLGIQYYDLTMGDPGQPQLNRLKSQWTYGQTGLPGTFYNLSAPATWYSYGYGDLVDKGATEPWNNWDRNSNTSGSNTANAGAQLTATTYPEYGRVLGEKHYELSDHLGNVLATILDRKTGSSTTHNYTDPTTQTNYGLVYDFYNPDIINATDYYPFGMEMPGRSLNNVGRFGFNGKQNDNEVYNTTGQGSFQDYGMRSFNPLLARFVSVDPLTGKYPYYTPYQFAGNKPIKFVDLDGLEPAEPDQSEYKGKTWAIDWPYEGTGGDNLYNKAGPAESFGSYGPVDKNLFFANDNGNNDLVNEKSQFYVSNESKIPNENALVNFLLGSFAWGKGPENYVFPTNGKFANILKESNTVGDELVAWMVNGYADGIYRYNVGAREEINADMGPGVLSLEHFLGSAAVKISKISAQQVQVEIFNVTSFSSGYLAKDIPVVKWFVNAPQSTRRSVDPTNGLLYQPTYSNISQYFKIIMSYSEAESIINNYAAIGNATNKDGAHIK